MAELCGYLIGIQAANCEMFISELQRRRKQRESSKTARAAGDSRDKTEREIKARLNYLTGFAYL